MSGARRRTLGKAIVVSAVAAVVAYIMASIILWLVSPIWYGFEEPQTATDRDAAVDLAVGWVEEVPGRTEVSLGATSFEVREVVAGLAWTSVDGQASGEGWIVESPQIGLAQYALLVLVSLALAFVAFRKARPSGEARREAPPNDRTIASR
jgi:hypothetical protein